MIRTLLLGGLSLLATMDAPPTVIFEAEAAKLGGTARAARCAACSGGWMVGYIGHHPKSDVIFDVAVDRAGLYDLTIYYLLSGSRTFEISVNGGPGAALELSANSWQQVHWTSLAVALKAGRNTLRLYNDTEYTPDLDRITLTRRASR
jgi:hypothetical protein